MRLLGDSWKIVLEQKSLVVGYVAWATFIILSQRLLGNLFHAVLGTDPTLFSNLLEIAQRVLVSGGFAALSAVYFSRLGKEIDKPLWKCSGNGDSLHRFFMPWFILFLCYMLLDRVLAVALLRGIDDAVAFLDFFMMAQFIFLIPIGACIMYWGRLDMDEIPEALSPIAKQLPLVSIVLLMGFIQYFLGATLFPKLLPEYLRNNPLVYLPMDMGLAVVDCWMFITMWLILIIHRDYDYDRDVDF